MASDPIDLQDYFPFFLGTISNRWTTSSSKIYLDRFGVGIADWRVLASIQALGAASSQEIVGLISMDAAAVSRSVTKLETEGFIARAPGRFVGRTKPYELTGAGRELALAREDLLLGALTTDERRSLMDLMRKVLTRIGEL
jgi:DNA-binding MarR family transcriptional regulator